MRKKIPSSVRPIQKKAIKAPQVLNEPIYYSEPVSFSRGISMDLGQHILLFISGTASINKNGKTSYSGDFLAQAKRTFKNLTALLKSEKADWHSVVKTTCYLKDMRDYGAFNKVRNQFYKQQGIHPFPASTCVQAQLCRPDLLVEIDLIAVLKPQRANKSH